MKKNKSFISYDDRNAKHPIISALHKKGVINIELYYASHWSTYAGWDVLNSNYGAFWLGYSKVEALKFIEEKMAESFIRKGKFADNSKGCFIYD